VTVTESRFTVQDKMVLLASRRADQVPRGSHGFTLEEATDPANQYRFKADLPTTDFAAKALKTAQDAYEKTYPDADMSSLLWRVDLKD
jgi:hypothetical protein